MQLRHHSRSTCGRVGIDLVAPRLQARHCPECQEGNRGATRLGVGLAIVNDICRLPAGTTSVPIPELPAIDYYLLEPAGRRRAESVESLRALIIEKFKR